MALNERVGGTGRPSGWRAHWGRVLFFATLVIVLVFFWWLLIRSGGAVGTHG